MSSPVSISRERTLVVALLGLHATLAWLLRLPGVMTGGDDARYLLLAEQLRHLSYRSSWLVGEPLHTLYPPGYPALLALWGIFDRSFDWAVVLSIVCSITALGLVFLAVRERWGPAVALPVLAVLAVNPLLVPRAGMVLSEAPYLALTMAALWAAGRPAAHAQWWALGTGLYAGLVRAAGATMLPALAITWLRTRQRRPLIVLLIAGTLAVGGWQAFSMRFGSQSVGTSYAADFQEAEAGTVEQRSSLPALLAHRVQRNAVFYATRAVPGNLRLVTLPGTQLDVVVGIAVWIAGVLVGLVIVARKWFVAGAYLACYVALLAVWPWQVRRFIEPVIPLLVVMLLVGWHRIAFALLPRSAPWVVGALATALIATGSAIAVVRLDRVSTCVRGASPPDASCVAPEQASFFAALSSMRGSLPTNALVLSSRPSSVFYYSGARGVEPPLSTLPDSAGFVSFIERYAISHILLTSVQSLDIRELAPTLEAHCSRLRVRRASPPFTYLFTLDTAGDGREACRAIGLFRRANRNQRFAFGWLASLSHPEQPQPLMWHERNTSPDQRVAAR